VRALLQRVSEANVTVEGRVAGAIGVGLLVFICVGEADEPKDLEFLLKKIPALRIFPDEAGKMNLSVSDVRGSVLVVSQFTLMADTSAGNRPAFTAAAKPEKAIPLYETFVERLRSLGLTVACGIFGADMKVRLLNDGPVTIMLDSRS
jgi:D-tyrosyl-tRNA(Tyr) deacylase